MTPFYGQLMLANTLRLRLAQPLNIQGISGLGQKNCAGSDAPANAWFGRASMAHDREGRPVAGKVKNAAGQLQIVVVGGFDGFIGEVVTQTGVFPPVNRLPTCCRPSSGRNVASLQKVYQVAGADTMESVVLQQKRVRKLG